MSRMRKKKNLDVRLARCASLVETEPAQQRGHWREKWMPHAVQVRVELGCGKGLFTVETAAQHPDMLFIAVERVADALVMALERCMDRELTNVCFVCGDAVSLREWFAPNEADLLYINFCDPWPAKRHAKRRLIHENFLLTYRDVLAEQGEIHFKTDNAPLFDFALTQFPRAGYCAEQITRDLHQEEPDTVMTDFEAVFHQNGVKIHRCVAVKTTLPERKPEELPPQSLLDYWHEGDPIPRGMDEDALHLRAKERKEAGLEQNQ